MLLPANQSNQPSALMFLPITNLIADDFATRCKVAGITCRCRASTEGQCGQEHEASAMRVMLPKCVQSMMFSMAEP